jgi:TP53 regulating kinase-like protein
MRSLGYNIGMMIGKLHSERLSHGDLTTSNVILRSGDPDRVCLIDFGLSSCQSNIEDFGVDMYVLERAIRTTHVDMEFMMDAILNGYQAIGWKDAKAAVKKLDEVRLRGRNREMTG